MSKSPKKAVSEAAFPTTARGQGLALLDAVFTRKLPLDDALDRLPGADQLAPRDRALARLLASIVLRRRNEIDAVLAGRLAAKMPKRR